MTGAIKRGSLSPRMATRNDPMIPWQSYKWSEGDPTDRDRVEEPTQLTHTDFERALRKVSRRVKRRT